MLSRRPRIEPAVPACAAMTGPDADGLRELERTSNAAARVVRDMVKKKKGEGKKGDGLCKQYFNAGMEKLYTHNVYSSEGCIHLLIALAWRRRAKRLALRLHVRNTRVKPVLWFQVLHALKRVALLKAAQQELIVVPRVFHKTVKHLHGVGVAPHATSGHQLRRLQLDGARFDARLFVDARLAHHAVHERERVGVAHNTLHVRLDNSVCGAHKVTREAHVATFIAQHIGRDAA